MLQNRTILFVDNRADPIAHVADAIIAATAFLNNLKLATRNEDDFKAIAGLELFNPLE